MQRVASPITTRTTGIDILDSDNLYRMREIDPMLNMLNEDDGTFLKLLSLWGTGPDVGQMYYSWVEDTMLDTSTLVNNSGGYTAAATSIVVDDSRLFIVNSLIHITRTLENLFVTAVDYTTHTLTVTRGYGATAAAAINDNEPLVAGTPLLPENSDALLGNGHTPTTETYNYCSRYSESFRISHVQEVAKMWNRGQGTVGSIPWEAAEMMFNMRRKINKSLIFSSRFLDNSHADGTIYNTQGFVHAVKSHQLDVGDDNSNLSWPLLSQFLDETFQDTASSPSKVLNAGSNLYGAVQLMQRDMQVPATSYFSPELNLDVITITTEQGHRVDVVEDRHGFPAIEGLSGYGLVIDMAWAKKREYNGEPMTWRTSIESPSAHVRQDEIWGSYSLQLMHEKTHGLIRGAAGRYVNRTAGIV